MSVNIIWSLTNGGDSIADTLDHGNVSNGSTSAPIQELFLRHDGTNSITDAGIYVREVSTTYGGGFTAATDLAELLEWADAAVANDFGGVMVHFDAAGGYASAWPTVTTKDATNTGLHRTGTGDSAANAITIPTATGATAAGTVQAGNSPNVRFQVRIQVPTSEDLIGVRQYEHIVKYNFTS
jgi:hypothetical protein